MDSNPNSKKGQEGLFEEIDSNPYGLDSKLDSSKFAKMVGFESPSNIFESLMKKKMRQRPWIRIFVRRIRIP